MNCGALMIGEVSRAFAGKTVFVVEDEPLVAMSLAEEIEAAGGAVIGPAGSVASALRMLTQDAPDLAVLDIELEGEAAYPIADALRARGVPFLFTTGFEIDSIPPLYADIPAFQKPYMTRSVIAALADLLK